MSHKCDACGSDMRAVEPLAPAWICKQVLCGRWKYEIPKPEAKMTEAESQKYAEKADALMRPVGGHPEFHAILEEMRALHVKKAADYGSDADPLKNIREAAGFIDRPGWVAAMVRCREKMVRLQEFIKKGVLRNESAADSIIDIACLSIIALILYREEGNK